MDTHNPETHEIEDEDGEEYDRPDVYVEIATRFLYDVKFFDGFILVRPSTPEFYSALRRVSYPQFAKEFEPFCGIRDSWTDLVVEVIN